MLRRDPFPVGINDLPFNNCLTVRRFAERFTAFGGFILVGAGWRPMTKFTADVAGTVVGSLLDKSRLTSATVGMQDSNKGLAQCIHVSVRVCIVKKIHGCRHLGRINAALGWSPEIILGKDLVL